MDIVIVIAKVIKISLLTFMDMTIIRQSFSFFTGITDQTAHYFSPFLIR